MLQIIFEETLNGMACALVRHDSKDASTHLSGEFG
jgi:hypothetical protein